MDLKGTTFDGKDILISVIDCPVRIDNKTIILANKPGSPLIATYSLRRVINSVLEEYAYVFDSDKNFMGYILIIDKRIKLYNPYTQKYVDMNADYEIIKCSNVDQMRRLSELTDHIRFYVDDQEYLLKHILAPSGDDSIVMFNSTSKIYNLKVKDVEVNYG